MNDDTFFMNQTAMDDPNVIVLMNVSGNTTPKQRPSDTTKTRQFLTSSQFLFLCSRGLVYHDRVPVSVFELAQLLDELVDPVITCRQARVFLDHCDCDHVVVVVLVSCSWFCDVSRLSGFFFFFL